MTTRLAEVMLSPPPARVDTRNTKRLIDWLNSSTTACRCRCCVVPSSRLKTYPLRVRNFSRMSSRRVLKLNRITLSFCPCHSARSFSSANILPQCFALETRSKLTSARSAPPSSAASSPSANLATSTSRANFRGSSVGSGLSSSRWLLTFRRMFMHGSPTQYGHRSCPWCSWSKLSKSGANDPGGGRSWQHFERCSPLPQSQGSSCRTRSWKSGSR